MNKDFNPENIEKVSIDSVRPNSYNPKVKDSKEYSDVVESLKQNGLMSFIFVREVEGEDGYEIVDGEHRYLAAKELGYQEIYIYNLGKISEEEARALTLWFEVQVSFDEVELAPIVVELSKIDIKLPYTDEQINKFEEMQKFDFDDLGDDEPLEEDEKFANFKIRLTEEQFALIDGKIRDIANLETVSEGRAMELIVADSVAGMDVEIPLENE